MLNLNFEFIIMNPKCTTMNGIEKDEALSFWHDMSSTTIKFLTDITKKRIQNHQVYWDITSKVFHVITFS